MTGVVAQVIVKVASRCNLNCSYCYLYNHEDRSALVQPTWMTETVFDALLRRMASHAGRHGHGMGMTLHGGEPTLVGIEAIERIAKLARARLGDGLSGIAIQTNGTLIDAALAETLRRLDIAVGISLDGPAEVHDRYRVTHSGVGSHASTMAGIAALKTAGVPLRILCVVQPGGDGLAAYRHFRDLGADWIDFLLPDVSHDNRMRLYGNAPHPVADYLLPILDEWLREGNPAVRIPIFWDLLARLMGGTRAMNDYFGNSPLAYVIVNSDGSIEPLDALKVCAEGMTRTPYNVLTHGFDDLTSEPSLLADTLAGRIAPSATCQKCRYGTICAGGYLPHRYRRSNAFDNPSVWCTDIQLLLDRMSGLLSPQERPSAARRAMTRA